MHHAQDFILTIGSLIFMVALIPSILSVDKPAVFTSLSTGLVLIVFAGVYVSLSLWFSAATTLVTGLLWLTLAMQKLRQTKNRPD